MVGDDLAGSRREKFCCAAEEENLFENAYILLRIGIIQGEISTSALPYLLVVRFGSDG